MRLPGAADVDHIVAVRPVAVEEHDEVAGLARARLDARPVELCGHHGSILGTLWAEPGRRRVPWRRDSRPTGAVPPPRATDARLQPAAPSPWPWGGSSAQRP